MELTGFGDDFSTHSFEFARIIDVFERSFDVLARCSMAKTHHTATHQRSTVKRRRRPGERMGHTEDRLLPTTAQSSRSMLRTR